MRPSKVLEVFGRREPRAAPAVAAPRRSGGAGPVGDPLGTRLSKGSRKGLRGTSGVVVHVGGSVVVQSKEVLYFLVLNYGDYNLVTKKCYDPVVLHFRLTRVLL